MFWNSSQSFARGGNGAGISADLKNRERIQFRKEGKCLIPAPRPAALEVSAAKERSSPPTINPTASLSSSSLSFRQLSLIMIIYYAATLRRPQWGPISNFDNPPSRYVGHFLEVGTISTEAFFKLCPFSGTLSYPYINLAASLSSSSWMTSLQTLSFLSLIMIIYYAATLRRPQILWQPSLPATFFLSEMLDVY